MSGNGIKTTKKRKSFGRMCDVAKKLRLNTHEAGEDCKCLRLKCFTNITEDERQLLLKNFNEMDSHNAQNGYLCSLMRAQIIKRRRPRCDENVAKFHERSFSYHVKIKRQSGLVDIPVCAKGFRAIYGISKKKLEYLQRSLKNTGYAPKDKRGRHHNRPNRLPEQTVNKVKEHIASFKGRTSHYTYAKTKKIYLPEELNLTKMHKLYMEKYSENPISYEQYRKIFVSNFNISFGYPRSDSCSICDEFLAKLKVLEKEKLLDEAHRCKIEQEKRRLTIDNEVHKKKAETFYERKRQARKRSRTSNFFEAITLDYQQNLPMPNISTNDVYYKRQLSLYTFNIHTLSNGDSVFYIYPQITARKGANEVVSMLHHFITTILNSSVRHLQIFCDSCPGQNKNFIMFRYLHYIVHQVNRLDYIQITFPIRGHSYLECDKNMGLINKKARAETPSDWVYVFRNARTKPSPFQVIEVEQDLFRSWTTFLTKYYKKNSPIATRDIKEIYSSKDHPQFLTHRSSYNGMFETTVVVLPNSRSLIQKETAILRPGEFMFPDKLYKGKLM